MKRLWQAVLSTTVAVASVTTTLVAQPTAPSTLTQQGFEKLKALEGEWIDVDGAFGTKGAVAVTYRVTSAGTTVVETFPVNTPYEMVTVYHLDGNDLILTHFCTSGQQPRMRSKGLAANSLTFDPDGGTNVDPTKRDYMHSAKIEFVSADEIRSTWRGPNERSAPFRIVRNRK